ncbi:hypothetical protein [Massilia sp. SYSU DXS3249]
MEELLGLPGGDAVAANQVLYNLTRRGIEFDLVLRWVLRNTGTIALPKAGTPGHVEQLRRALDIPFSPSDLA